MNSNEVISGVEFSYLDHSLLQKHGIGVQSLVDGFRGGGTGEVIQQGPQALVRRLFIGSQEIYLKLYRLRGLRRWVNSEWARGRALRAFQNARRLADLGIKTAPVLAVVGRDRNGTRGESGLFTLSLSPAQRITLFFLDHLAKHDDGRERLSVLRELGSFLFNIHERGVYPRDFKDSNVLLRRADQGYSFYLVDYDGFLFASSVSLRRRLKNLYQIGITLGETLTREERLSLLRCYCEGGLLDEPDVERLEQEISGAIQARQQSKQRLQIIRAKGI
jgi:tRNA A-37 threonylcarbamoyl transferase component Bud32